jgi:hypothetical protein
MFDESDLTGDIEPTDDGSFSFELRYFGVVIPVAEVRFVERRGRSPGVC